MKTRYWLIISVLCLIVGFLIGTFIKPGGNNITATNWVVGNKTNYYSNYTVVTNNPDIMLEVYNDYFRFMTDPFRVIQLNQELNVALWKRNFSYRIIDWQKNSGPIAGGGWDVIRSCPVVLVGWEFKNIGVLGTVSISTNLGLLLLGYWKFNIY